MKANADLLAKELYDMGTAELSSFAQYLGVPRQPWESDVQLKDRVYKKYVGRKMPKFADKEEDMLW